MNGNAKTQVANKKLTRIIAAILTVAFLGFVFTAFFVMLIGGLVNRKK